MNPDLTLHLQHPGLERVPAIYTSIVKWQIYYNLMYNNNNNNIGYIQYIFVYVWEAVIFQEIVHIAEQNWKGLVE